MGLLGTLSTYIGISDHMMFTFGRNSEAPQDPTFNDLGNHVYLWDNQIYANNYDQDTTYQATQPLPPINDFWITNNGDSAGQYVFGYSYGDHIMPFAAAETVQILTDVGKNDDSNADYFTIQPIGYVPAPTYTNVKILPPGQVKSILISYTAAETFNTGIAPPCGVPSNAIALITTIYTYTAVNDHQMLSFGRNASHPSNLWQLGLFSANTYTNDVLITHDGDVDTGYYYGYAHGMQIIPLKPCGTFDALMGMGKNDNSNPFYVTIQVYGYITSAP